MRKVLIYTDGAFKPKTKCGGIGFLLTDKLSGRTISSSRRYANTSSDRMELMAAKEALEMLQRPCDVEVYSDSRYLCDSVNKGWLKLWLSDPCFMNRKNEDLWREINDYLTIHKVTFNWIRSHSFNDGNRFADALANKACRVHDALFLKMS